MLYGLFIAIETRNPSTRLVSNTSHRAKTNQINQIVRSVFVTITSVMLFAPCA